MSGKMEPVEEVINLFSVPEWDGVYVLGCFARYGTLYSQQVRALNLIYALNQTKKLGPETKVAIFGAGAAGLTATIAAARLGARVTLMEKLDGPLGLQRNSQSRYIHPHIYDWPAIRIESDRARLPVLDWSADYASVVAERLRRNWESECRRYPDQIATPHWGVHNAFIEPPHGDGQYTLNWNDTQGPHGAAFDAIIIAVGFGLENAEWPYRRYWENDQLDTRADSLERRCLVSGCGDGGLTDLMRLCIKDFKHDAVLKLFGGHPLSKKLGDDLLEQERRQLGSADYRALSDYYQNRVEAGFVRDVLKNGDMLRTDTTVFLTGYSWWDVYSSKSSILNRFIVSQLARMRRWSWVPGPIESVTPHQSKYVVHFPKVDQRGRPRAQPKDEEYDIVVLRHGAKAALKDSFPDIWAACEKLDERWKKMPPHQDPTRTPLPWGNLFDLPVPLVSEPAVPLPGQFKLVVFDIDGTLLQGVDFVWSWTLVWHFLGYSDEYRRNLMSHYLKVIRDGHEGWHDAYKEWCDATAVLFKNKKLKRSDFVEITRTLRPVDGLRETIQTLMAAGIRLAIVSGGIDQILTEKLSEYLPKFEPPYVNKFLFDEQGLFTGVEATKYDFKGKLTAVLEICDRFNLSQDQVVFVGDGFNDVDLPGNVGRTICFAGSDPEMRNKSTVNIDFKPPRTPDLWEILQYILPPPLPPRPPPEDGSGK